MKIRAYDYLEMIEANEIICLNYWNSNIDESVDWNLEGVFSDVEERLKSTDLTLEYISEISVELRHPWKISLLEEEIKRRFNLYPNRKH